MMSVKSMRTPRIAVIQDLSCVGRCSLGVAMAVLPTVLLSAHTAFPEFTFLNLSDEAAREMAHWQRMGLRFDAIYVGYLASVELIGLAARFIEIFRVASAPAILDPAFGDSGRLYTIFDAEYVRAMRGLCAHADIILPNITEACFLLDITFAEGETQTALLAYEASRLLVESLKDVLLTSCDFEGDKTGPICVGEHGFVYSHEHAQLSCHGSGDLFVSAFVGLYVRSGEPERAARAAADFTCECIRYSMNCEDHRWYGVDYEPMLPELIRKAERS